MRSADLVKFILAREAARRDHDANAPWPWGTDPIIQKYRFCNVHREDDKVTKWIAKNWRGPNKDHDDLWFAMVVARLFNKPETLDALGYPSKFDKIKMGKVLFALREKGPIFNGAYIVSTNGKSMDKVEYLLEYVLEPLWAARKVLRPGKLKWLASYHQSLMRFDGMGSFMAAQVVADLKYVEPLKSAEDWWTWAASGPGSRRGLNRIYEYPPNDPWKEPEWLDGIGALLTPVNAALKPHKIKLHAQDLQNCLCEFDKYERVRLGEGTPKQLYRRP